MSGPRYALYYAPAADEPLFALGREWLGRDVVTGESLAIPDDRRQATVSARHYGFHATLKPPMALAGGRSEAGLLAAAAEFAASNAPAPAAPLVLADLDGFLALVPAWPSAPVQRLCDAVVRGFEPFRAPPEEADIARRRKAGLSARQEQLLARWGYPYLFDEFRLHLTLSDRLTADQRASLRPQLEARVAALPAGRFLLDAIAVFRQEERAAPFMQIARFALTGRE
ncbi:MAG: DUF1045 domain-containing protein [Thalassobaculales bacterium]